MTTERERKRKREERGNRERAKDLKYSKSGTEQESGRCVLQKIGTNFNEVVKSFCFLLRFTFYFAAPRTDSEEAGLMGWGRDGRSSYSYDQSSASPAVLLAVRSFF